MIQYTSNATNMISMKEFMEIINYRVTNGSEYLWDCYGATTFSIDHEHSDYSLSIIFDTTTNTTYEITVCDYLRDRAYRLVNSEYKDALIAESSNRKSLFGQAWDNVYYVDLETKEDFISKATSILHGEEYDTRVSIPMDLDDDVLMQLMLRAHEADKTLNELVADILTSMIEEKKKHERV